MEKETTMLNPEAAEQTVSKLNLHNQLFKDIITGPVKHGYLKPDHNFPGVIGNCPEMQKVYSLMSIVASSNSTVLLLGETGTGKEVIARAIHQSSLRKNKQMVTVNCAALPANLIESELFGHERGAFTGAADRRIG
jgi:transcriptional regulator with GAF, ATPase, and Fis domain